MTARQEASERLATTHRLPLIPGPTPLYPMAGLSREVDQSVWVKRDDLTGVGMGGNKVRKLEFLLADAKARGYRSVITGGGVQSNHAAMTAVCAQREGLACYLALNEAVPIDEPSYQTAGNMAVNGLSGAQVQISPAGTRNAIATYADAIEAETGKRPYEIPMGGSNSLGAQGYARAALELQAQLAAADEKIQQIVHASSSAGTQAGLLVGLELAGLNIEVVGVSALYSESRLQKLILNLCEELADRLQLRGVDWSSRIRVNDEYLGPGYGLPTAETWGAIRRGIRAEGVVTDPVYSGKALHYLLDHLDGSADSKIGSGNGATMFWHTGGVGGLMAYAPQIQELPQG